MARFRRPRIGSFTVLEILDFLCLTTFLAVLLAVLYRQGVLDATDPYGCGALLNLGHWLDSPESGQLAQPFQNWQPPGCMMHEYDGTDMFTCLKFRNIVFIGDSTIRSIFWATAKKLDKKAADEEKRITEKHIDLSFTRAHVTVEFIWDPFLNSSKLQQHLVSHRNSWDLEKHELNGNATAAVLMVGGGLWHIRHTDSTSLRDFKASMENVMSSMALGDSRAPNSGSSKRIQARPIARNLVVIAPVQIPLYESLCPAVEVEGRITPARVDPLNDHLRKISTHKGATVAWSYALMTQNEDSAYRDGGIHVVDAVARQKADVLLNMRCNAELTRVKGYPMDKTCCNRYPGLNWVQAIILIGPLVALPLIILLSIRASKRLIYLPSSKISRAMLVMTLALFYSFYADRTHLFNKSQKQYSPREFKILCLLTITLGILSLRRCVSPVQKGLHSASNKEYDQPFLSRHQTDEWKGWMQFVILIYHYTGASKILEIYEIIRILVASYLFMTGFGHALFFYQTGNYSFRRLASVLIRLNMLSCLLPYIMRTDYLFYYFAPLITFWYITIYVTMGIAHSQNSSLLFLTGKIVLSACLITALIRTPGLFEKVFLVLEWTSRIHWNVTEWRFRLQLDGYIVFVGMTCGILFSKISASLRDQRSEDDTIPFIRRYWLPLRLSAIIAALIILPVFWRVTRPFSNKFDYNGWVPYISCFPILSFVVLRNCSRHVRNFHSSIFAWLGRHSLETFTLQFHIWLAADTRGLLALGIFGRNRTFIAGRWPDFALLTVIFFWVSWHVAAATGTITAWIIDPSAGRLEGEEMNESRGAKLELPRTRSKEHLNGGYNHSRKAENNDDDNDDGGSIIVFLSGRSTGLVGRLFREDLRFRLGVILGVMWVLNMVSFSSPAQ
ncbi:hypothetical protein MMC07_007660 [Pseudocyphellaria aurata]|nr:hypothetical protein [Pseudocyphellaria aurata]